ncbi:enoyl-CoA hydratase/isomerase family protein [Dactylosporangium sp. CA-139066]|uniref:enoyl-CoA hydratase/isomerase family protein n=1 Tax=Dactylosporangium sp. CA-139066 TaxID=3239930 RepID=UPI003D8D3227
MKKNEYELLASQWDAAGMTVDDDALESAVLYETDKEKSVAYITFNVPEKLNAIPVAAFERVGDLVREAEYDDEVKTIVFRGNGDAFGTGADAAELGHYIGYQRNKSGDRSRPSQRQRILPDRNLLSESLGNRISNCLKATICQVQGYCYGGHIKIALGADIVIASPDAQFTHPAFRYLGCAPQDMYLWIENLGMKKMREIMLTMRPLTAEEGEKAGFINQVVPKEELAATVDEFVTAISFMPLDGLMMGKSMMRIAMEARGKGVGEVGNWIGHAWATNLSLREGEYNFVKERRDKGLAQALKDRDAAVAPRFRLGGKLG